MHVFQGRFRRKQDLQILLALDRSLKGSLTRTVKVFGKVDKLDDSVHLI